MDWCLYKYRHLVENAFARLKHFRAIATRYDKLKGNCVSMVAMACCLQNMIFQNQKNLYIKKVEKTNHDSIGWSRVPHVST